VIKKLNLKFKIKENPHGVKLKSWITPKTTMKMILVAMTTIFWVPMMN